MIKLSELESETEFIKKLKVIANYEKSRKKEAIDRSFRYSRNAFLSSLLRVLDKNEKLNLSILNKIMAIANGEIDARSVDVVFKGVEKLKENDKNYDNQ